ncbi:MAG: glycoside hydrolase family 16 protein [Acidimicrobiales bacterium]
MWSRGRALTLVALTAVIGLSSTAVIFPWAAAFSGPRDTPALGVRLATSDGGVSAPGSSALVAPDSPASSSPTPSPTPTAPVAVEPKKPAFVPAKAKLVFDGEFSGRSLNKTTWTTCLPWWESGQGCTNEGDQSQNWDLPVNDVVTPGNLSINMRRRNTMGVGPSGRPKEFNFTSGMVSTGHRFAFSYGYVAIRAKVARGDDVASAFCLFPASLAWPPEIDILEYSGSTPNQATFTYHAPNGTRPRFAPGPFWDLADGWHTFGLAWTPGSIVWYIDGYRVFSTNDDVTSLPMYLTLGVSVYSATALTPAASSMDISWARIWQ